MSYSFFNQHIDVSFDNIKSDGYKTRQHKLFLTKDQKNVIDIWLDMYVIMYNCAIKFFKRCIFLKLPKPSLNVLKKQMTASKDLIYNVSSISVNVDGKKKVVHINRHILDYALNDALNAYDSCITNLKKGHIRNFRLRYLKLSKSNKIFKLEKLAFTNDSFCPLALGKKVASSVENFRYLENIHTVAIVTKRRNEYFLLIKYPKKNTECTRSETIALDPGTNPYLTGYSEMEVVEIGKNVTNVITKKLKIIDKINETGLSDKKINKAVTKRYEKIKNMVNDMHWKIAKYLTDNYKNILIGNLSTKRMGEGKLNPMTKRVGNMLALYKLKQKIKYKSEHNGNNYKEVDESYTTQCCGRCGNPKKNLGGKKIYECNKCGIVVNRDAQSARSIMIIDLK